MLRPLLLAAALLAPAAALAQSAQDAPLPPASTAPSTGTPPTVSGDVAGAGRYGRMNMSPEMRQARQAMMQACAADFAKLCADTPAGGSTQGGGGGGGGRMQCLRQHASELSDGCRGSMQAMRAARQGGAPPAGSPQG